MAAWIKRRILLLILCGLLIVIVGITLWFVLSPKEEDPSVAVSGEAEAVMTTKTKVFDGLWDAKRYSDEFYLPIGITVRDGNLIVADSLCDRIQIIDGVKNKRIGKPGQYGLSYLDSGALVDGYKETALFMKPSDVAVDSNGDIVICDTGNHAIRRMDDEAVVTIAGNGDSGYADGKESEARFNSPRSVAVGTDGMIYVADTMNHCIRRIDTSGNVTLYAGTPEQSGYRDGVLTAAQFYEPSGLTISPEGYLYIADAANHCIRKISGDTVSTVAGTPGELNRLSGYPEGGYTDGDSAIARFNFPRDVTMLEDSTLVIADTMNHSIRMLRDGEVKTLAGGGLADQYYSSAENVKLSRPEGVCADGDILYISDTANNRIVTLPLTERILEGRPSHEVMLETTGVSTNSKYAYKGDIRVYIDSNLVDMGRVPPWNTPECIYVPIRPLFEALGAIVTVNEKTNTLTIKIGEDSTVLRLNQDYFILKGVAVTTTDEIIRLFPYTFEWYAEFSLIALHVPSDLRNN